MIKHCDIELIILQLKRNINMKVQNLIYTNFSSMRSTKHLLNALIVRNNQLAYGFGSYKRAIVPDQRKIVDALKGKTQIKVWTIEDIIERSLAESKSIGNLKSLSGILSNLNQLLTKQSQNSNHSFNIVINKYFSSIQNLTLPTQQTEDKCLNIQKEISKKELIKNLIEIIKSSQKWSFLPHYQSVINRQKSLDSKQLKLLIGDYNDAIIQHLPLNSYITLEQLCAMYPQKVPLSYRRREVIESIRQGVSKRLSEGDVNRVSLSQQPRFDEIVIINDRIKMWDEAYQVMLDELPIRITVPYHVVEPFQEFRRLNINNFISGFKQCHRIIHPEIPLQIQQQTLQQFISDYFSNQPKDMSQRTPRRLQVEIMDSSLSEDRFSIMY